MGKLRFILLVATAALFGWSAQTLGADYYVTESESGMVAITDHEPEEGVSLLKGPFKTRAEAEEALSDAEKEKFGTRWKGKGQEKGKGRKENP
jgi:hypothetical protein